MKIFDKKNMDFSVHAFLDLPDPSPYLVAEEFFLWYKSIPSADKICIIEAVINRCGSNDFLEAAITRAFEFEDSLCLDTFRKHMEDINVSVRYKLTGIFRTALHLTSWKTSVVSFFEKWILSFKSEVNSGFLSSLVDGFCSAVMTNEILLKSICLLCEVPLSKRHHLLIISHIFGR